MGQAKKAILLVEPDVLWQEILLDHLAKDNFLPLAATNARDALQLQQTYQARLAILEMQLPDMSGLSLAVRLRSQPLFPKIAIIILTHERRCSLVADALSVSINEYLVKSEVSVPQILLTIRQLAAREREF